MVSLALHLCRYLCWRFSGTLGAFMFSGDSLASREERLPPDPLETLSCCTTTVKCEFPLPAHFVAFLLSLCSLACALFSVPFTISHQKFSFPKMQKTARSPPKAKEPQYHHHTSFDTLVGPTLNATFTNVKPWLLLVVCPTTNRCSSKAKRCLDFLL